MMPNESKRKGDLTPGDNEINLAVARACGLEVDKARGDVTDPLDRRWIGSIGPGPNRYDPRNDDAKAIAALKRIISGGSLKAYIIVTAKGYQVEIVTYPEDAHVSWAENAKLSVAITDAILAAQEKRNA